MSAARAGTCPGCRLVYLSKVPAGSPAARGPGNTTTMIQRLAAACRGVFDRLTRRVPPVLLVAALGAIAARAGTWVTALAFAGCPTPPFSLLDLELTFSAESFAAMVRSAIGQGCQVSRGFGPADLLYAVCYGPFLCALYLWAERFRRFPPDADTDGVTAPPDAGLRGPGPASALSSVIVLLPFLAAALDIVAENLPLHHAAAAAERSAVAVAGGVVLIGSVGAALKWTALAIYALGLVLMLLRGPRGIVLWRLRYSVIAVLGGSLAVLVVPQGQDILQRLVEGAHPYWRIVGALAALTGTALVVWYSARVLALVRFARDAEAPRDPWMGFFETQIPRMLGVAVLALAGLAFARAALATGRFAAIAVGAYLLTVLLAHWRSGTVLSWLGRRVLPTEFARDVRFSKRAGRALLAAVGGALIVWPSGTPLRAPDMGVMDPDQTQLRVAAWIALVLAWVLYLFVYHRRDLISRDGRTRAHLQAELAEGYGEDAVPAAPRRAAGAAAVVSAAFFVGFTWWTVPFARALGPLVLVALAVANAVYAGSVLAYLGRWLRLPLVALFIALAVVFSRWNDNHEIRTLRAPLPAGFGSGDSGLSRRYERWIESRSREDPDTVPVLLVAAAGGGLRAAYWTAVTLGTLQDRDTRFARHVFAISGVSGGSLGAAVFATMVRDLRSGGAAACRRRAPRVMGRPDTTARRWSGVMSACARRFMADDFLSPVLAKMVAPDFFQWFVPFPIRAFDRATALEQSWEVSYDSATGFNTLASGYLAFSDAPDAGAPLLLLNTTHVQTGRRYVTAPFGDTRAFLDARGVVEALGTDLRLSTAVHNSARFAYVSPAGRIERHDGESRGSLVDGGYFENSGLTTIQDVLRMVTVESPRHPVRLAVIYLCNDPIACRRDLAVDSSLAARPTLEAEWLSPLLALLGARNARGSLARADVAADSGVRVFQLNVCDSLYAGTAAADSARARVVRDRVVNPPLGWQLSRLARDWMDASLTTGIRRSFPNPTDSARVLGAPCRAHNVATLDSIVGLLPSRRR